MGSEEEDEDFDERPEGGICFPYLLPQRFWAGDSIRGPEDAMLLRPDSARDFSGHPSGLRCF